MHVVLKEFFRVLFNLPTSPEFVGWNGERLTVKVLKKLDRHGHSGRILRNVYVPTGSATTEIDVLYVTRKGIFVLESKNYSGWIFGNESDSYWTQATPREKHRFYNPLKQNATHCRALVDYLTVNVPTFSVVVFSERCELKKIAISSPNALVVKRDRLYRDLKALWKTAPDVLTPTQCENVYLKLEPLTRVSNDVKKEHVRNLREKYRN